jgi:hypothetical protein
MKRIIAFLLLFVLGVTACGPKKHAVAMPGQSTITNSVFGQLIEISDKQLLSSEKRCGKFAATYHDGLMLYLVFYPKNIERLWWALGLPTEDASGQKISTNKMVIARELIAVNSEEGLVPAVEVLPGAPPPPPITPRVGLRGITTSDLAACGVK